MTIPRGQARETILGCAEALVRERGAGAVTVEAVAKAAGSAKGLVHYHFKTKAGLLSAVLERLAESRASEWTEALKAGAPKSAVERSWELLTEESASGVALAWHTLLQSRDLLADHVVKKVADDFRRTVGDCVVHLLDVEMDLSPTVPAEEVGWLMTAVIDGIGLQLIAGASEAELHGAYAAAWLGVLSLTSPQGA
jgi:AcrR family transcriptional regulator